jgi:hypothetical protein
LDIQLRLRFSWHVVPLCVSDKSSSWNPNFKHSTPNWHPNQKFGKRFLGILIFCQLNELPLNKRNRFSFGPWTVIRLAAPETMEFSTVRRLLLILK